MLIESQILWIGTNKSIWHPNEDGSRSFHFSKGTSKSSVKVGENWVVKDYDVTLLSLYISTGHKLPYYRARLMEVQERVYGEFI